jgi:DNA polymerase-1
MFFTIPSTFHRSTPFITMPPTLYLIDGHALAYRTYFALSATGGGRWQTSKGEPTAAIYGFATVLMRILEIEKPDYIAVAFDTGKTFRDKIFPAYKATRAKMPDDLRPQIERIRQMVDVFNIPRLEMEGYEADDVLGSVAKKVSADGLGVKIITGDRDLLQLVGNGVIVNIASGKLAEAKDYITDAEVIEYFGVPPRLVVDYKALIGDKSDNIPGVPGVGEKTALELFKVYKSLDDIYASLDLIPPKVRTKLEAGRESAYLSRDLATIHTDLPVTIDLSHAKADNFDRMVVEGFFREMEFRSLIPKLGMLRSNNPQSADYTPKSGQQLTLFDAPRPVIVPITRPASGITTHIIDSEEKLKELVQTLASSDIISFDTETTSTEEMQAEIVGISLSVKELEGYYIPVGHKSGVNLPIGQVIAALRPAMTDPNVPKIGHNAKYDYLILARLGLKVSPLSFDSMIAEWLIDPSSRNLGLKNLAFARLGEEMTHIEELIGPKGKSQRSMDEVDIQSAAPYAVADAEMCIRLRPLLLGELDRVGERKLLDEIEMPLVTVLAEMELVGVLLDQPFFEKMSIELGKRMGEIEMQVFQAIGKSFNINSTQQLSDVLFKTLKLEPPDRGRKTASGHFSTSADVLEELSGKHPVVNLVLENRELSKLKSTYVDTLPQAVDPVSGRVHTSYSQTTAITGRLSSSNPNLQNIPTRTDLGRKVRNGFIAAPGNVLLSVDYSQVELRIVAHVAGDQAMLEAFRNGQDIHATTAAAIYNIPLDQVTKEMRRHAKAINFGLIYGMSAFGLTRSTELTLSEADAFVKAYFQQFPGVKKYLDNTKKYASEYGYVETLLGRRRYFPALKGNINQQMKNREEREAINAPIQGTAADIMKIAMIHIPAALKDASLAGQMLLQVHDEIVIECPLSELEKTVKVLQSVMENAYELSIPLSTEARSGRSWGEMKVLDYQ